MQNIRPTISGITPSLKLTLGTQSHNTGSEEIVKPNLKLAMTQSKQSVTPNLQLISGSTPLKLTASAIPAGKVSVLTPTTLAPIASNIMSKIEISQETGESKTTFEYRRKLTYVAQRLLPTSSIKTNILLGRVATNHVIYATTYNKALENVISFIINNAKTIVIK